MNPQAPVYHWILTLTCPDGRYSTFNDTNALPPGTTRHEAFNGIVKACAASMGTARYNVLFFSIEPEQL
ncbi:hypothetical protein POF50_021435 [Streptomyces sp. SL13]|uniref:Uncharacterized protein n=1 Tax=Streptantibioticus silvisoli TaxID=2705255 RepID=A0AA90KHU6_9ACTN|nr:hypothetical protein [Streptantibioticus silvisoli]MDI5971864.1 hypothetical protein [Streptantibioticus silvisoli]